MDKRSPFAHHQPLSLKLALTLHPISTLTLQASSHPPQIKIFLTSSSFSNHPHPRCPSCLSRHCCTSTRVQTRRRSSSSRRTRSTSLRRSSRLRPSCLSLGSSLALTTSTGHSCSSAPQLPPLTVPPLSFTFTTSRRSSTSSVSVLTMMEINNYSSISLGR